jgi:acyl-CoA thioesterase-1
MRKLAWLAAIAIIVLVVVGFWQTARPLNLTNLPPSASGEWAAFGDSLTEGFGASEGHDYPNLLGQKLGLKILNHGASGETSGDALGRLEAVAALKPRVVLLCFGGNDGLQRLPPNETFHNLARIIDRLHRGGSFVVLLGIRSATLRDHYEEHFRRLAREKRVLLVPNLMESVLFSPNLMSDAIHPNDAGYQAIAERLEAVLLPIMKPLRPTN